MERPLFADAALQDMQLRQRASSSSMLRTSVSKVPCLIDVSFSLACWTVLHDRDLVRQD